MKSYIIFSFLYGAFIMGSGIYRYLDAGSKNALWFGIVMGAIAILASFIYYVRYLKISYVMQIITILFVGGFFIKKLSGDMEGDSTWRVISLIVFSALMLIVTLREIVGNSKNK